MVILPSIATMELLTAIVPFPNGNAADDFKISTRPPPSGRDIRTSRAAEAHPDDSF